MPLEITKLTALLQLSPLVLGSRAELIALCIVNTGGQLLNAGAIKRKLCIFLMNVKCSLIGQGEQHNNRLPISPSRPISECFAFTEKKQSIL